MATTFTLDPTSNLPENQTCTVTVKGANVTDQDGMPQQLAADYTFSFTIAMPVAGETRIRNIQGAAHISPLVGNNTAVTNVPGTVTALRANGFYMQDPNPDGDDATSEGIFVFTSSAPTVAVGNSVLVSGAVSEFRPGGNAASNAGLSITQIGSPTIIVLASGVTLPTATTIGAGGRVPPTIVIDDDATGSVETSGTFDPATDGIDFYESLEGMLVQVNNAVAVGPTSGFSEIPVLADGGANAGLRTPRGGIIIRPDDFNPERIILDDLIPSTGALPSVNVGDGLGTVVGVIDYSFGNFKLGVTVPLTRADNGLPREVTAVEHTTDGLTIATFNVENLDPNDADSKFSALASVIADNLKSPDIIALEEIQDNNGATNDGLVDATLTFQELIDAIRAEGGPTYEYRQTNPVDDQDGGEPGGNIRVGFLFRTDRGVSFVDRAGGCSVCAVGVVGTGDATQLSYSPGRIDPTNSAFNNSRKPLAGEFRFNGRTVFVVANHFNSKGGDQPLFGRYQPPTRGSEVQRKQQAQIVHDFVQQLITADPNANVVVLGDINDFQFSEVVAVLTAGGVLTSLINTLPENERYSYVFDGNSQTLDQILVSPNLAAQFPNDGTGPYDVVHVNAEFFDQISDHDPQVARFTLTPPLPTAGSLNVATPEDVSLTITLNGTAANGGPLQYSIVTPPARGTLGTVNGNGVTYTPSANLNGSDSFTYKVTEDGRDSGTATVTIAVGAVNDPPVAANGGVSTPADTGVEITLTAADTEGSALTYSIVTGPAHGTLGAINGNRVLYTPAGGYSGPDSFTFRANDGGANSNVATILIGVIPPPPPPSYTLTVSTTGNGTVTPGTGTYSADQAATLTATPNSGAVFIGWTVDGVFAGFANPLAIGMNANHTASAAFAPKVAFSDVGTGTPFNEAITRLAARGVIQGFGDGTFGPAQPIKRAESAALIARAMGWDAEDHDNPFIDRCDSFSPSNCIDDDLWRNVGTLAFYDVARGYPDRLYYPRDEVSHVQVISFITRAMVAKGYWIQATVDDLGLYPNVPEGSGHRLDLVTFVQYAGAIPGRPANENWADWNAPASRGWYADVLDQALSSRFITTP